MIFRFFIFCFAFVALHGFDKVVIWGHKLHTHTHSYIHERFFKAFTHMGYQTYWLDEKDDLSTFDFSNTLFLTEGQVDSAIPLRDDCRYILHNCQVEKYRKLLNEKKCITLQVYTKDVLSRQGLIKAKPFIYYDIEGKCIYMPWASDLLPHEIEEVKKELPLKKSFSIHWVGTIGGGLHGNEAPLMRFSAACKKKGLAFVHHNPWKKGLSDKEACNLIRSSFFSPAIVGGWQEEQDYIPCRIFIAISNGQMGVTNSKSSQELFEHKLVYNKDTYQLLLDAVEREKKWSLKDQYQLMDFVKENHTYINRIQNILEFLKLVEES